MEGRESNAEDREERKATARCWADASASCMLTTAEHCPAAVPLHQRQAAVLMATMRSGKTAEQSAQDQAQPAWKVGDTYPRPQPRETAWCGEMGCWAYATVATPWYVRRCSPAWGRVVVGCNTSSPLSVGVQVGAGWAGAQMQGCTLTVVPLQFCIQQGAHTPLHA